MWPERYFKIQPHIPAKFNFSFLLEPITTTFVQLGWFTWWKLISGVMLECKIQVIWNQSIVKLYVVSGSCQRNQEITPREICLEKCRWHCYTCFLMFLCCLCLFFPFFFWRMAEYRLLLQLCASPHHPSLKGCTFNVDTTLYLKWGKMIHILPPFSWKCIYWHVDCRLKWWKSSYVR